MLRRLHLLKQKGMIAFFDPEEIVQVVGLQGLDVGGIGTQAVFSDDERETESLPARLDGSALRPPSDAHR